MPIGSAIANGINVVIDNTPLARTETFESQTGVGYAPARMALVSVLTAAVIFVIILFVGKFLWNSVLHELVPAIKPAKSVWQILGLAILISLLHPGCCNCTGM
jgi:hypothetical protein